MGEPLYENVVGDPSKNKLGVPCRIYAPVGNHETLLKEKGFYYQLHGKAAASAT